MTIAAQVKAEAVLALHLALRHRAVRLTGLLLVVALGLARDQGGGLSGLLLLGGLLAATAASRPLAPGPAFHTARRAAASATVTVLGRLAGVVLLLVIATLVAAAVLQASDAPATAGRAGIALVAICATAALVLALAPMLGASGAAGVGILATLFGQISPTALSVMLDRWPLARDGAVLLWNTTPLGWRADRWAAHGGWADPAVLLGWIVLGAAAAVWALQPPRDADGGAQ